MSTKVKDLPVTISTKGRRSTELLDTLFENAGIDTGRQKWDDLESLYQEIANSILIISNQLNDSLKAMNLIGYKSNELNITIQTFNTDILNFSSSISAIRAKHIGKTGFVTSPDDLSLSMEIFNDYTIMFEHFKTIVLQPSLIVTEHYSEAMDLHNKKIKEQVTSEPEITDVEIIEKGEA